MDFPDGPLVCWRSVMSVHQITAEGLRGRDPRRLSCAVVSDGGFGLSEHRPGPRRSGLGGLDG